MMIGGSGKSVTTTTSMIKHKHRHITSTAGPVYKTNEKGIAFRYKETT